MFDKGEYIVYGQNGVCQVKDITYLDMSAADKKQQYYMLIPVNSKASTIYCPVNNEKVVARPILTKEEAWNLIDSIPDADQLRVSNEKLRENEYKQSIRSGSPKEWIKIIKTLYLRKQERIAVGKKITTTDEKYLKSAEDLLYSELSMAIGKPKTVMEEVISERVDMLKAISEEQ
jgi:CarD family transcriptional regulator